MKASAMRFLTFVALALLLAGCLQKPASEPATPTVTATQFFITATLPLPTVPPATATPSPPEPTSTPRAFPGLTIYPVNVRANASAFAEALGVIPANTAVEIIGRNEASNWWQIRYNGGSGWVVAEYVQTSASDVPVAGALPTAAADQSTARVQQRLNVRSGPGTNYDSFGMLEPETTIALTGKNATATWLQIVFPAGPNGRGWVTAIYVQAPDISNLPVLDESGALLIAPTADPNRPTPTATVLPASPDGDSPDSPGGQVTLSPGGTRSIAFSGGLSAPTGDSNDWLSLTAVSASGQPLRVTLALECEGDATIRVELSLNGSMQAGPACGQSGMAFEFPSGKNVLVHLFASSTGGLAVSHYTFIARSEP